jgi:hypothetical protein
LLDNVCETELRHLLPSAVAAQQDIMQEIQRIQWLQHAAQLWATADTAYLVPSRQTLLGRHAYGSKHVGLQSCTKQINKQ